MENIKQIINKAGAGNIESFETLIKRFQNMAFGLAYAILKDSYLAEDVVQESFIEIYKNISKLKNYKAFAGWLKQTVIKYCDRMTRRKKHVTVPLDMAMNVKSNYPEPHQIAEQTELRSKVIKAVLKLPENLRTVTTLFYIDNYKQKDIAAFLSLPVSTIKKRLYSSRRKLKELMMDTLKTELNAISLPGNFAGDLLMFPFPKLEPEVKITDCPDEDMEIRCIDAQSLFVPLIKNGRCNWTFYDRPRGNLSGIYEYYIVDFIQYNKATFLKAWSRYTEFNTDYPVEWQESHYQIENNAFRRISLKRDDKGKAKVHDYIWPWENVEDKPHPMILKTGIKSKSMNSGQVMGVSRVTINGKTWKCLKVAAPGQHFKDPKKKPTVYAEWYINTKGRTIFFRRYNGPNYTHKDKPTSFESLKGQLEIEFEGRKFRHVYDTMPDIVFEE